MKRTAQLLSYGMEKRRHELTQTSKAVLTEASMHCDVIFGSPTADCRGTGVCKITAYQGFASPLLSSHCKCAPAFIHARNDGKGIEMVLVRELVCTTLYRKHLRHGAVVLTESCKLPGFLVAGLGLQVHTLRPGVYPVKEHNGIITIQF
jgi:hypothetical protein